MPRTYPRWQLPSHQSRDAFQLRVDLLAPTWALFFSEFLVSDVPGMNAIQEAPDICNYLLTRRIDYEQALSTFKAWPLASTLSSTVTRQRSSVLSISTEIFANLTPLSSRTCVGTNCVIQPPAAPVKIAAKAALWASSASVSRKTPASSLAPSQRLPVKLASRTTFRPAMGVGP